VVSVNRPDNRFPVAIGLCACHLHLVARNHVCYRAVSCDIIPCEEGSASGRRESSARGAAKVCAALDLQGVVIG
jgi:hypothetical protein